MNNKLKLSEAIALGSKVNSQGFGDYISHKDGKMFTCALGAAAIAVHCRATMTALLNFFPDLSCKIAVPEICFYGNIFNCIWQLNDTHKWPREKIADCLAKKGY